MKRVKEDASDLRKEKRVVSRVHVQKEEEEGEDAIHCYLVLCENTMRVDLLVRICCLMGERMAGIRKRKETEREREISACECYLCLLDRTLGKLIAKRKNKAYGAKT